MSTYNNYTAITNYTPIVLAKFEDLGTVLVERSRYGLVWVLVLWEDGTVSAKHHGKLEAAMETYKVACESLRELAARGFTSDDITQEDSTVFLRSGSDQFEFELGNQLECDYVGE